MMNSQPKITEPTNPKTPFRQGWFDNHIAEEDIDAWADFKETPDEWDDD
jgi:hypothetical protein